MSSEPLAVCQLCPCGQAGLCSAVGAAACWTCNPCGMCSTPTAKPDAVLIHQLLEARHGAVIRRTHARSGRHGPGTKRGRGARACVLALHARVRGLLARRTRAVENTSRTSFQLRQRARTPLQAEQLTTRSNPCKLGDSGRIVERAIKQMICLLLCFRRFHRGTRTAKLGDTPGALLAPVHLQTFKGFKPIEEASARQLVIYSRQIAIVRSQSTPAATACVVTRSPTSAHDGASRYELHGRRHAQGA